MATSGIYVIENIITREFYLGAAKDVLSRFRQHRYVLNHGIQFNPLFTAAWRLHGRAAFRFTVICLLPPEECFATEERLLRRLVGTPLCYNLSWARTGGMAGRRHSSETLGKMRTARVGRRLSPEHRAKIGAGQRGLKKSAAAIEKYKATAKTLDWDAINQKRRETLQRMKESGDPAYDRIVAAKFQHGHQFFPRGKES